MQINNRQQMLVIVAAAGVALLVADRLVITPLKDAWKERAARIVELRKVVIQGAQLRDRERTIRDGEQHEHEHAAGKHFRRRKRSAPRV